VEPPPHVSEHSAHSVQGETAQSMGHAWTLHVVFCASLGHGTPPYGCTRTVLERCFVPFAHDFVQVEYWPQSPILQLVGVVYPK